jgi:hypothetical protein
MLSNYAEVLENYCQEFIHLLLSKSIDFLQVLN